jgi:hypothetical protein
MMNWREIVVLKNSKEWIRWKEFKWLWWGRCRRVKGQDDTQPKLSGNEGPTCEVELFVVARVLQNAGMLVHVSLGSVIAPRYLHFLTPLLSHVNSTHSCLLSLSLSNQNESISFGFCYLGTRVLLNNLDIS